MLAWSSQIIIRFIHRGGGYHAFGRQLGRQMSLNFSRQIVNNRMGLGTIIRPIHVESYSPSYQWVNRPPPAIYNITSIIVTSLGNKTPGRSRPGSAPGISQATTSRCRRWGSLGRHQRDVSLTIRQRPPKVITSMSIGSITCQRHHTIISGSVNSYHVTTIGHRQCHLGRLQQVSRHMWDNGIVGIPNVSNVIVSMSVSSILNRASNCKISSSHQHKIQ